jgi:biopolymer transport protein ExbB
MKNLISFLVIFMMLMLGASNFTNAQSDEGASDEAVESASMETDSAAVGATDSSSVGLSDEDQAAAAEEGKSAHQQLKRKFIEGGPGFMASILLCFILGLAIVIERVLYLNLSTTNTKKLLNNLEKALDSGGVEAAKELCRNTSGPVASIFFQGLDRVDEGIDVVEKSVISYGSVQIGLMEKGLTWISLFISIAPMLGFLGTVVGMVQAFDAIQAAGTISPTIVAGGIKVALITTVGGLIVAIILQIFYNYIMSKIDNLVSSMEDASVSLIDILVKFIGKK